MVVMSCSICGEFLINNRGYIVFKSPDRIVYIYGEAESADPDNDVSGYSLSGESFKSDISINYCPWCGRKL